MTRVGCRKEEGARILSVIHKKELSNAAGHQKDGKTTRAGCLPPEVAKMLTFSSLMDSDEEFLRIHHKMKSTLMKHKFVMLSDYKNVKMWSIDNPVLEERYKSMHVLLQSETGEDSEHEFFHGSPFAWDICQEGFNVNYSKENNYFGKGVYFTAHASKANQYSWGANTGCPPHIDRNCDVCPRYLLVCSCLMGKTFHAKRQPLDHQVPDGYHSVVADPKDVIGLKYPEYILLNGDQALPKTIVEYYAQRFYAQH